MSGARNHSLVRLAEWTVRGSDVSAEMNACELCGLILIKDRRGTLLISHGDFRALHKHLYPTQRLPACLGESESMRSALHHLAQVLAAKGNPRFRVVYERATQA